MLVDDALPWSDVSWRGRAVKNLGDNCHEGNASPMEYEVVRLSTELMRHGQQLQDMQLAMRELAAATRRATLDVARATKGENLKNVCFESSKPAVVNHE